MITLESNIFGMNRYDVSLQLLCTQSIGSAVQKLSSSNVHVMTDTLSSSCSVVRADGNLVSGALRVSIEVFLGRAHDKTSSSITHVFLTVNMCVNVSLPDQWFNAAHRRSSQEKNQLTRHSRVGRALRMCVHVRCDVSWKLSVSFLRGVNWSSCSTGLVLVCGELNVTKSVCLCLCVCVFGHFCGESKVDYVFDGYSWWRMQSDWRKQSIYLLFLFRTKLQQVV